MSNPTIGLAIFLAGAAFLMLCIDFPFWPDSMFPTRRWQLTLTIVVAFMLMYASLYFFSVPYIPPCVCKR
jgi:hypothetical protein